MTQHRCTGCKVFSVCLGDVVSFLCGPALHRCRCCNRLYIVKGKPFTEKDLCVEFASHVDRLLPRVARLSTYSTEWCGEPCLKLTKESYTPKPLRRKQRKKDRQ